MPLEEYTYLNKGMKGTAIKELQQDLLRLGFSLPKFGADGDYGSETEAAVKDLQFTYQLPVTGIVNDATANLIKNMVTNEYAAPVAPKKYVGPTTAAAPVTLQVPTTIPAPTTELASIFGKIDFKWIGIGLLGVMILFYFVLPKMKED